MYIGVVGIDGSGKSTLSFKLFKALSYTVKTGYVGDKILLARKGKTRTFNDAWLVTSKLTISRFAKNTKNPALYGISKLLDFVLRQKMMRLLREQRGAKIVIEDGASLINLLGWGRFYHKGLFSRDTILNVAQYLCAGELCRKDKVNIIKQIPELFLLRRLITFTIPQTVFFLKISPKVAMQRIRLRRKPLQKHENKEFLRRLQSAYEEVISVLRKEFDMRVFPINVTDIDEEGVLRIMEDRLKCLKK